MPWRGRGSLSEGVEGFNTEARREESLVVWLSCPLFFLLLLFVLLIQRNDTRGGHVGHPPARVVVGWVFHPVALRLHLAHGAVIVLAGGVVILTWWQVRVRIRHWVARRVLTPTGPDAPPYHSQALEATVSPARPALPHPLKSGKEQLLPSMQRWQDLCSKLCGVAVGVGAAVASQVAQQRVLLIQAAEAGAQSVRRACRRGGLSTATSLYTSTSTFATGASEAEVLAKLTVDQVLQVGRIRWHI